MPDFQYINIECKNVVEQFSSGEPSVDLFLKEKALKYHKMQSAITRLYFDEGQNLIGFLTLHNDVVTISNRKLKKYSWDIPFTGDLPAIKLHYIGVDQRFQKQGYGEYLLAEAISICNEVATYSGCNFITVEAIHGTEPFYVKYGFSSLNRDHYFSIMALKLREL
jgi:GNAT superfamily N-acetyltransferase